ncbi:hypothetical protein [Candidatus Amarolinea dominans]|uniref:hypothetical protein n=1 Tax=Candidatus Amarolinea dominans TaxID=3140696 RepID=UPI0031365F66|nr:hypothetical protein [Anaerolineae bacterium]
MLHRAYHRFVRIALLAALTILWATMLTASVNATTWAPAAGWPQESATPGSLWLVNTIADSGTGSLRWALTNAAAGDRIEFAPAVFPPGNPARILVTSALPRIGVNGLTISAVGRGVILDGRNAPTGLETGMRIDGAAHVTIQGLQLTSFPKTGLLVTSASNTLIGGDRLVGQGNVISGNGGAAIELVGVGCTGNTTAGNLIGTDATGMTVLHNGAGIVIASEPRTT